MTASKTSLEKWICVFSVSIVIIPTPLLCQMQTDSSGAEFLSTISKFRKRKKFCRCLFASSTKREIRHFHVVVVQWRQRNVQLKKRDARARCCFALSSCSRSRYRRRSKDRIFSGQIEMLLLIASETFFWLISSSFVSGWEIQVK